MGIKNANNNILKAMVVVLICCLTLGATNNLQARQFRIINIIKSHENSGVELPEGVVEVSDVQPIERELVDRLAREALAKWNTPEMADTLAEDFFDKSRWMDNMSTIVPRDAKLRVQSVQGIQTLQQYIVPETEGGPGDVVSIVSATIRTQIEFNDPEQGFITLPGVTEFILKITVPDSPITVF